MKQIRKILSLLFTTTLAASTNAAVLSNDAVVAEKTVSEWTAKWWEWAFTAPTNQSPLVDTEGSRASYGQSGPVFFLAGGVPNISSVQRRAFSVPANKYLFLCIVNAEWDNIDVIPPLPIEQLRDNAAALINSVTELHASIDGVPVIDVWNHRVISPVFSVDFTSADNPLTLAYPHPITGLVDPIVLDGYWLMIEPLPPGQHVIDFGVKLSISDFSLEVSDEITIESPTWRDEVQNIVTALEQANLPQHRIRPLLVSLRAAAESFERTNLRGAVNQLHAFQNKVRAQVAPANPTLANDLMDDARHIIDQADAQLDRAQGMKGIQ